MATITVYIPEPCRENWKEMKDAGCGRHCTVCDKVVVDFTALTTDEVQDYFRSHSQQKICGHFKTSQVQSNYTSLQQSLINAYHRIEAKTKRNFINAACLFVVGCALTLSGCTNQTTGAIAMPDDTLTGDTISNIQSIDTTAAAEQDATKSKAIHPAPKIKKRNNR